MRIYRRRYLIVSRRVFFTEPSVIDIEIVSSPQRRLTPTYAVILN